MSYGLDRTEYRARFPAVLLALSGIAAFAWPADAAGQYSVSPVIIPLPASAEDQEIIATVRNEGSGPLQLRVYAEDYDQAFDGSYEYAPFGRHGNSCAGRLEVLPEALSVPAGGAQPITIRLAGDENPSTCWSLIYVENPAPDSGALRVATRLGVKVYGLSEEGAYEAAITGAEVREDGQGRVLAMRVENPQLWPLLASGSVAITDLAGNRFDSVPVHMFSVLPERDREVRIPLDMQLEPGRYMAIPVIEFGSDGFAGAQVGFRVDD